MPVTLPPILRRKFIKGSLAFAGTAIKTPAAFAKAGSRSAGLDQNRVALLADTHIMPPIRTLPTRVHKWPGSPVKESEHEKVNMAKSLADTAKNLIVLNPLPAHLIINGDMRHEQRNDSRVQRALDRLIEPIRLAGITIHVTIGNHDNRENLWKLLPFLKKEQMGIHAEVIELPHANLILLDSGRKGILGRQQLNWLAQELDGRTNKPALIFGHFNPYPNRGVRPIKGMSDGSALLKLLAKRKHARAYFYGHTHEWQQDRRGHLHLINQPAVSYYFGKGHAHGWVDMKLTKTSADLKLHCINLKHAQHGERREIGLTG